ncbi:MAG TPA: TetR/AcrR family transcriptional regulator, partial [Candidatus Nesterenkonia stercoripullorum]|nr:TetR/AcrR family transcriptional regulator [Candidatus Nesterenkonia stercoripullorum]
MAGITRTPRAKWIEAGLSALTTGGPRAVRIEALAQDLGVSKGGFYGFFPNRDALLQEMLDTWERESIDDVLDAVSDEEDPRARAHRLGMLTFAEERLPLEFAVRAWAQHDESVTTRLRRVDSRRMDALREVISSFCDDPQEVEARCLLAF